MTAPTPASFDQIAELRHRILRDLDDGDWAGDIAKNRGVTMQAAMALFFKPGDVSLCRDCVASGRVNAEKCPHCAGLGYTTGVRLG